jgi:hypothetical protein
MVSCLTTLFLQSCLFDETGSSMFLRNLGICQPHYMTSHARIQPLMFVEANWKQQTFRNRNFFDLRLWERTNRLYRPQNPFSSISSGFIPTFKMYFYNIFSSTAYLHHTYMVCMSIAIFINCFTYVTDLLFCRPGKPMYIQLKKNILLMSPTKCSDSRFAYITIPYYYYYLPHASAL